MAEQSSEVCMPVFARLSRRFYEVVGEDVTQQLVDWLNQVEEELTSRARLRLHNELSHARLNRRRMASRSRWPEAPLSPQYPLLRDSADLRAELRRFRSDLIWWMFLYCVSTLLGTLLLLIALR
jgi:hypothetical protein